MTATPSQLTFTPANWDQPRADSVRVVDDVQVEANDHTVASADGSRNRLAVSDVGVTIEYNDTVGLNASGAENLAVPLE